MSRKKRIPKVVKSTKILTNSNISQWCYVNTENEFKFLDIIFVIDNSVEEYKVHNKAGTVSDYTNEAYMEEILATVDTDNNTLKFYNQNYDEIKNLLVQVRDKRG